MSRTLVSATLSALALLLVACPKDGPGKAGPVASAMAPAITGDASASAVTSAGAAPSVGSASASASANAAQREKKKPLSADERAKLQSYHAALSAGRKATLDKDYPAAIKAFDGALAAKPEDPRALSERGYAKLLARDFKSARTDLDKSARTTTDNKLRAAIAFNQGLSAESLGEAAAAQLYFARSNALNPTKPAQTKLEGKSKCPAALTKDEVKGSFVGSWRDAWTAMTIAYAAEVFPNTVEDKPTSDDAVKKLVCEADCKGEGPWVVTRGNGLWGVRFLAAMAAGNKIALVPLGAFEYFNCGGDYKSEISGSGFVHLKAVESVFVRGWTKEGKDGFEPCDEKAPPETCFSACAGAETTVEHLFMDLTKPAIVLSVGTDTDAAHAPLVTVKETNGTVTVNGAGCNETVRL